MTARVMLVDDSDTIRKTATAILESQGFAVYTAADGFEAMSAIIDHRPDVIIVDIMMPRLDGYQTCAMIKANCDFKHTPVIMLSSKDGLFDRARGRVAGSDMHINKPFTRDELLSAVARYA